MVTKSQHFLSFDLFQQVVLWLSISSGSQRRGRHFLETTPELLCIESDRELERLTSAHQGESAESHRQMHNHLELLRDVRRRGGTPQAIREAYVNAYGGFSLDIPGWLSEIEQDLRFLTHLRRPDRTNRQHIRLLRQALSRCNNSQHIAPEIVAQLLNELGHLLTHNHHNSTQHARIQALEEAIHCHKTASTIFTPARYPLQYASTMQKLGSAYHHYAETGHPATIEYAVACYQAALHIYRRERYPEQWATLQTTLGRVYSMYSACSQLQAPNWNREQAIACHKAALSAITPSNAPTTWATVQANLGDAYRLNGTNDHRIRNNCLQQAMLCYRAALHVFTLHETPEEWADIHIRLAATYDDLASLTDTIQEEQRDKLLRCSIVCYEGALLVYSIDSYPVKYATIQTRLGHLHRRRPRGNRQMNLEQARKCYHSTLNIFTKQAFATEYAKIQQALAEIETEPVQAPSPGTPQWPVHCFL